MDLDISEVIQNAETSNDKLPMLVGVDYQENMSDEKK